MFQKLHSELVQEVVVVLDQHIPVFFGDAVSKSPRLFLLKNVMLVVCCHACTCFARVGPRHVLDPAKQERAERALTERFYYHSSLESIPGVGSRSS